MTLIFRDCDGIPGRAETLRACFPGDVVVVTSADLAISGALPVRIPDDWLPRAITPRRRAEWFAADTLGLAAWQQLGIDDDHVWFVESDVWAPDAVWRAVFAATSASDADGIFAKLLPRDHPFAGIVRGFGLPGNPSWVTHAHIQAVYRLSKRALGWCLAEAEELRECFSEQKTASTIVRRGGSVRDLREFVAYSAPRAFAGHADFHRFTPGVMNHPVKIDIGRDGAD